METIRQIKENWNKIEVGLILVLFSIGMVSININRQIDPTLAETTIDIWISGDEALYTFILNEFVEELTGQLGAQYSRVMKFNITVIPHEENITAEYLFAKALYASFQRPASHPTIALVESRLIPLLNEYGIIASSFNYSLAFNELDPIAQMYQVHFGNMSAVFPAFYSPVLLLVNNKTRNEMGVPIPRTYQELLNISRTLAQSSEIKEKEEIPIVAWEDNGNGELPFFVSDAIIPAFKGTIYDAYSWKDGLRLLLDLLPYAREVGEYQELDEQDFLSNGGLFLFQHIERINNLRRHSFGEEYVVQPLPSGALNATPITTYSWVILGHPTVKEKQLLARLLDVWYSPTFQRSIFNELGQYATRNGTYWTLPENAVEVADHSDFLPPRDLLKTLYLPPSSVDLDFYYGLQAWTYNKLRAEIGNETLDVQIDNKTIMEHLEQADILMQTVMGQTLKEALHPLSTVIGGNHPLIPSKNHIGGMDFQQQRKALLNRTIEEKTHNTKKK